MAISSDGFDENGVFDEPAFWTAAGLAVDDYFGPFSIPEEPAEFTEDEWLESAEYAERSALLRELQILDPVRARRNRVNVALAEERFISQQSEMRRARIVAEAAIDECLEGANQAQRDLNRRIMVTENALELQITEAASHRLLRTSEILVELFPKTMGAVEACAITLRHAEIIADIGETVPADKREKFEGEAIDLAKWVSPTKLARTLALMRDRLQPETATLRHKTAFERRRVETSVEQDGMGWWTAYLSIADIAAGEARITAFALSAKGDGDERTMAQLKADVFMDIINGDDNSTTSVRPTVFVTMTAETAAGGAAPGELKGFGQITAERARDYLAHAELFYRVMLEGDTGNILEFSSAGRNIPAAMKRFLRYRDEACRFPGCNGSIAGAEIDHTTDFADGGPTSVHNLSYLCKKHHRLKHLAN